VGLAGSWGLGEGEVQVGQHACVDQRRDPARALLVEGEPLTSEELVVYGAGRGTGGGGVREEVHGEGVLEGYAWDGEGWLGWSGEREALWGRGTGVEDGHGDACPLGERGES
jgi:hypothetical protein